MVKEDKIVDMLKTVAEDQKYFINDDELADVIQEYDSRDYEMNLTELELVTAAGKMDYSSFLKKMEQIGNK